MTYPLPLWIVFNLFVFFMLALDLGVFHRKAHEVRFKEAITWSVVWVTLALLFNGAIYFGYGKDAALEFLAGYLIEKSLSVDNIFVFLSVFSYFRVPPKYQHKVLFWGILGALIMRAGFIFAGIELIQKFHWITYVFGFFLIFTGVRLVFHKEEAPNLEQNPMVKFLRRHLPLKPQTDGRFFFRENGKLYVTSLFLVLLIVEATDLIFAVDSIPAVLAVTESSFIAYTSNVFAILGLRSLYFALAGFMKMFHYLRYGLAGILIFVGAKMVLKDIYDIPTELALAVIFVILAASVLASKLRKIDK